MMWVAGATAMGGSGNSERCGRVGGGLGSKVISLGSLDGGLINRGDSPVRIGDEAGDMDGVGTISVGKTSVAESTGIGKVQDRSLSLPLAIAIAPVAIAPAVPVA